MPIGLSIRDDQLPASLAALEPGLARAPVGLSSDVLLQRPDVLQAEHQLKAANADIGAARAALFPTISLTAAGGFASSALSPLLNSASKTWSVTPTAGLPIFGICLGHQMLGLAVGGATRKMPQGHHGANHPVKDLETGKVEIVSMNHGFTVDRDSLPKGVKETHVSLFDGTNCGIRVEGRPIFSVQYHPEASPGPMDSHYLFDRFAKAAKGSA